MRGNASTGTGSPATSSPLRRVLVVLAVIGALMPAVAMGCDEASGPNGSRAPEAAMPVSVWAVGQGGAILGSTDGGVHWTRQCSGSPVSLNAVAFADAQHGWAVGGRGVIVRTVDGGATWVGRKLAGVSELTSVAASDEMHVWVGGSDDDGDSLALGSSDGGRQWSRSELVGQPQGAGVSDIAFLSDGRGCLVFGPGSRVALVTDDAGESWVTLPLGARVAFLRAVSGVEDWGFIAAGASSGAAQYGLLYGIAASDGPRSLEGVSPLNDVTTLSDGSGWAAGDQGTLVRTADGGRTWRRQETGWPGALSAVAFANPTCGWLATGGNRVLWSRDGGLSWHPQVLPTQGLTAIAAVDRCE